MPPSLSPSSIAAFKNCPLAFKFSYVERLPEPPSAAASKGTLVHKALELLMLRAPAERTPEAGLADLVAAWQLLETDPEFADLDLTPEAWTEFHASAQQLVLRYFDLEDPTQVNPIGLELKLEARLGDLRVRGIIDRLDLGPDGELVVTDYKTGSVPGERYESKSLAGVHIYAMLCEQMLGRLPARVQLYYLSRPEAIIAVPTEQTVKGVTMRTNALWSAIAGAAARDDFRPSPGRLCDYCTFKPYCPAHGGDPVEAAELRGPGAVIAPTLPLGDPVPVGA